MPQLIMDYDGTISDFETAVIDRLNEQRGTNYTIHDFKNWSLIPVAFHSHDEFHKWIKDNYDVLDKAQPYEDAQYFLDTCKDLCQEYGWDLVLFSCLFVPENYIRKYNCLEAHFGHKWADTLKVGRSKEALLTKGNIVVDDYPKNLKKATEKNCHVICIARPWNGPDSIPNWLGERYGYIEAIHEIRKIMEMGKKF